KDEQKFRAVRRKPLNGMRDSRREVPQIAFLYVGDETFAVRVNAGNSRRSIQHVSPFRRSVPVQFAHAAGGEPHVHARKRFRDRQFAHGHLARPSAFMQALVREGKGILERLHAPCIGRRRVDGIHIFGIQRGVFRDRFASASVAFRFWRILTLPDGVVGGHHAGSQSGRACAKKPAPRPTLLFQLVTHVHCLPLGLPPAARYPTLIIPVIQPKISAVLQGAWKSSHVPSRKAFLPDTPPHYVIQLPKNTETVCWHFFHQRDGVLFGRLLVLPGRLYSSELRRPALPVHTFVRFEPQPGKGQQLREELQLLLEPTRGEPGCIRIHLYEAFGDPLVFYIHSEWVDEA